MPKLKINTKSYESIPQRYKDIDIDTHVADPDWFTKLVQLCEPITLEEFYRHVGPASTYNLKHMLLNSLKFHYAVLSGALINVDPAFEITTDQKAAIISKIKEEITECTPGFHARIDSLLEGYFLPKTIGELLKLIRYNIVERAANKETNEVHGNNRFFAIAKKMGFGVQPKLDNDPYRGHVSDSRIRELLKSAFAENFQPFTTLFQLKTLVMSAFDQYAGRKEEGYPVKVYGPALEYLKNLFHEDAVDYSYLITHEETGAVCDINWNLILNKLWTILLEDNYFGYFSMSKTLGQFWGFRSLSKYTTTNVDLAIGSVSPIFLDPVNAREEDLQRMHHLFNNATECFAYLNCNPDLSDEAKITIIFSTLAATAFDEKQHEAFWLFVFENRALADSFCKKYTETYPKQIKHYEHSFLSDSIEFVN